MSRLLIAILLGVISVAFLREGTTPAGAGEFPNLIFPFPEGQTWQISKGYACELGGLSPCHPDAYDYSLDFVRVGGVTEGEAVRAVAAGTVVGYFYNDALGWQVEVRHSGGYRSFYGHLQAGPGFLPEDTPVAQGRTIGRAGCSGASCISSHIHFSFNSGGGDINDTKPEPVCGYTGFQPGQSFINCFPDADSDGIRDSLDNCGGTPEDADQYDDQDGCPEPEPDEGLRADFDGDGRVDVAHICCSNYIHTWFSNGDGSYDTSLYSPGDLYNVQAGLWRVGDFNGDGKADLAHICCSNFIHVWFSNGDGTFNVTQFFPLGGSYGVLVGDWRVADANGDGSSDLVHLCCPGYIHTWLSNGDGSFAVPAFFPPGAYDVQAGSWRVGDVNGDGKSDMVHLCCSTYIHTWISNGDGTYNVILYTPPGGGAYPVQTGSIYLADANGDGRSDLFHICCDDYIHTWLSNGDGTYNVTQYLPTVPSYNVQAGTWKPADVNGDGRTDLVHLCCTTNPIYTWISDGGGSYTVISFDPPGVYDVNLGSWRVGDINADGRSDLLHRCCADYWHTWISTGNGAYNLGQFIPGGSYDVQLGRWLMGDYASTVQAPQPTPTPTAATQTTTPTPPGQTPTPSLTPTPVGQTPTPTPTPTPPGQTPTPTPTGQTPTVTPTPSGAPQLVQGDNDCDGDEDAVDALVTLQSVAALPYNQQPDCIDIGAAVPAGAEPQLFGDIDCDGDVDAVDALQILRHVAGLGANQGPGCTPVGQAL